MYIENVCMNVCMYVCIMYVCMYVCMNVYIYIYIYIYIYKPNCNNVISKRKKPNRNYLAYNYYSLHHLQHTRL